MQGKLSNFKFAEGLYAINVPFDSHEYRVAVRLFGVHSRPNPTLGGYWTTSMHEGTQYYHWVVNKAGMAAYFTTRRAA